MSPLHRIAALAATLLACAAPAIAASRFDARTDVVVPFIGPSAVVAADFYGADGVPDLAVTFGLGRRVVLHRNDGAGNFTATDTLAPPPSPDTSLESLVADKPTMIIAGDFNADTLPDIVGGNEGIPRFFAYLNPGIPGGWGAPADPDAGRGNAFDIVAEEWNADAAADLAFCFPGRVGIALGEVDGLGVPTGAWGDLALFTASGFTAGTQTDIEVGHFLQRPADPRAVPDILTVDYTGSQLIVWPGDPSFDGTVFATAAEVRRFPVMNGATNLTPFEAIVGDWDGNGNPDVLVATLEGYLLYFPGVGGTTVFAAPVLVDLAASLALPTAPRARTAWTSFALRDVTGDGIDDALIADAGSPTTEQGFNWLTVVRGQSSAGPPSFVDGFGVIDQWHHAAADLDRQRPGAMAVADVDGDVDLDVVMLNSDAVSMTTWRNDGTGHFDGARSFPAGGPLPRGIACDDVDGDTLADTHVAISAPLDPAVRAPVLLPSDGAGGLRAAAPLAPAPGVPAGAHGSMLLSVNSGQDSNLDLTVTHSSDTFLWKGNGDGTFQAPVALGVGPGEPKFGELTGGAAPDVALGDRAGNRLVIWDGAGTGTFTQAQVIPAVYGYRDHVVAPFTGSAKADVVVAGTSVLGEAGLYFVDHDSASSMHLAPRFVRLVDIGLDPFTDVSRVAAGDFDADGLVDMVGFASSGEGYFFRNVTGTLTLDASVVVSGGGSPQGLAVADVSLDGIVDLIVAGPTTLTVNDGAAGSGFGATLSLPSNISNDSVSTGDIDGDSRPDLVAVSSRTSDVTVFLNRSAAPLVLRLGGAAGPDSLRWLDQGAGATYSVARGALSLAWGARDLGDGTCLRAALATVTTTDTDPLPPRQPAPSVFANVSAWWYLVKCAGGECSSPTFGRDSRGSDRFGGAAPPDPCP